MAFLEKENTFVKMYAQWLDKAANIHLENGSKHVCRLKQTCTPTGEARKYLTTITDVFLPNYAVRPDEARDGTQKNTQGVWPCHSKFLSTVSCCSSCHLRLHSCPE